MSEPSPPPSPFPPPFPPPSPFPPPAPPPSPSPPPPVPWEETSAHFNVSDSDIGYSLLCAFLFPPKVLLEGCVCRWRFCPSLSRASPAFSMVVLFVRTRQGSMMGDFVPSKEISNLFPYLTCSLSLSLSLSRYQFKNRLFYRLVRRSHVVRSIPTREPNLFRPFAPAKPHASAAAVR